jgi:hypothetical protein
VQQLALVDLGQAWPRPGLAALAIAPAILAVAFKDGNMDIPPPMGLANAINFQPTGGGRAAITGDFVLIAKEVNPVLRALREHGIEVTAIHNHMLDDQPHLYFMHFWANDDAKKLAEGLKAALAHINIAKS